MARQGWGFIEGLSGGEDRTSGGAVIGPVDAHCFPANFDLNFHIERRFTLRGHRFAVRIGANNLTAHRNPTAVNSVTGSPAFLTIPRARRGGIS